MAIAHVARSSKMRKACEVRCLLKESLCAVLAAGDELSSRESLAFSDIRDRTFLDFEVHPGCTESVFEAFADEVGEKPKKRYLHLLASQSEIPLILESIEPGQVYVLARSVMGEADNGRREGVPYAVVPLVGDAAFVEVCALSRADENRACVREYLDVLVAASCGIGARRRADGRRSVGFGCEGASLRRCRVAAAGRPTAPTPPRDRMEASEPSPGKQGTPPSND